MGGMGGMGGARWEHRADRMAQHHKMLHEALKLTPEQEGPWKKLMDSEHPMMKGPAGTPGDWAKLTAPERADMMLERMKAHQTQMTEHVAALKEFYGALTPEQQKTFDQFHAGQKGGMRGMRHSRRAAGAATQKP
jgi:Spy/CpxP family protein refolding chaperone